MQVSNYPKYIYISIKKVLDLEDMMNINLGLM
jgi:hypothetical protein